jgi:hypothetical protein
MTTFNEMIMYDVCRRPQLCGGFLRDLRWGHFLFVHIYQFEYFWEGFFSCTLLFFWIKSTNARSICSWPGHPTSIETGEN